MLMINSPQVIEVYAGRKIRWVHGRLDLRGVRKDPIKHFHYKKDARDFAPQAGWPKNRAVEYHGNLYTGWLLGEMFANNVFVCLGREPNTVVHIIFDDKV